MVVSGSIRVSDLEGEEWAALLPESVALNYLYCAHMKYVQCFFYDQKQIPRDIIIFASEYA